METVLPTEPTRDRAARIGRWVKPHTQLFADAGVTHPDIARIGGLGDELHALAQMEAKCADCDLRPFQIGADVGTLDRLVTRRAASVIGASDGMSRYRLAADERVAEATQDISLAACALMVAVEKEVNVMRHARPGDRLFPLAAAVVLADALRSNPRPGPLPFNTHAREWWCKEGVMTDPDYQTRGSGLRDMARARARLEELRSTNHTLYGN